MSLIYDILYTKIFAYSARFQRTKNFANRLSIDRDMMHNVSTLKMTRRATVSKHMQTAIKPFLFCFISQTLPSSVQCKHCARVMLMPQLSTRVLTRFLLFTNTLYECSSTSTQLSGLLVLHHGGRCVFSVLFKHTPRQLIRVAGPSTHVPIHNLCCPTPSRSAPECFRASI